MKVLFYTTETNDCHNHVAAWNSFSNSDHITYSNLGIRNDWKLVEAARDYDVVFYIGANEGVGTPKPATFIEARKHAKLINICSDAADKPWEKTLLVYRDMGCFDLQVSIDGAIGAPVDFVTLTPVAPMYRSVEKDIRCGFSGTVGRWNWRSEIINALEVFGGLTVRRREGGDGNTSHVEFMQRCKMLLNTSKTGSGQRDHIKGRVLEAGFAKCCLLEQKSSPIDKWFPDDCYILYDGMKEAADIIQSLDEDTINKVSARLNEEVQNYTAKKIYGDILSHVDITIA